MALWDHAPRVANLTPEPVRAHVVGNLLDGDALGLRHAEQHEEDGQEVEGCEEEEHAPLKGAEHVEEGLSDDRARAELGEDGDGLPG